MPSESSGKMPSRDEIFETITSEIPGADVEGALDENVVRSYLKEQGTIHNNLLPHLIPAPQEQQEYLEWGERLSLPPHPYILYVYYNNILIKQRMNAEINKSLKCKDRKKTDGVSEFDELAAIIIGITVSDKARAEFGKRTLYTKLEYKPMRPGQRMPQLVKPKPEVAVPFWFYGVGAVVFILLCSGFEACAKALSG